MTDILAEGQAYLEFRFGDETEALWRVVLEELSPQDLRALEVERRIQAQIDLVSEPIATAVSIGLVGIAAFAAICRAIERYIEARRQRTSGELLIVAFGLNKQAGEAMLTLQEEHAGVIKYQPLASLPTVVVQTAKASVLMSAAPSADLPLREPSSSLRRELSSVVPHDDLSSDRPPGEPAEEK